MLTEDKLWLPPLSPRDQKRLASFGGKKWEWLGASDKALWNWLQLLGVLAIPMVLVLGTLWFSAQQRQMSDAMMKNQHDTALAFSQQQRDTARAIAEDQQREATLNTYLDRMSELLLNQNLHDPKVRELARARTVTELRRLDLFRKGVLVQFQYESGLISNAHPVVDLTGADLSNADLSRATLSNANLSGAYLSGAILIFTSLRDATLTDASLMKAVLSFDYLGSANLSSANLTGTILTLACLSHANLTHTNLSNTHLFAADLSSAMLTDAILTNATLTDADLTGATLTGANLTDALLRGAHIVNGQLADVRSLKGAILPDGSTHP